jgi:hypothetical protein
MRDLARIVCLHSLVSTTVGGGCHALAAKANVPGPGARQCAAMTMSSRWLDVPARGADRWLACAKWRVA